MPWYAVYRQSDKELVSVGDTVAPDAEIAAKGLVKREFAQRPDRNNRRWNKFLEDFEDFVPPVEDDFGVQKAIDALKWIRNGMASRPAAQTYIDELIIRFEEML